MPFPFKPLHLRNMLKNAVNLIGHIRNVSLVPYQKYGHTLNSHDLLKAIAITLMILDHVGYYFMPYATELRWIGRFSFPIFFFLIGYSNNYRFKWDIAILCLVMILQDIALHIPLLPANILGNVIITRLALAYFSRWEWTKANISSLVIGIVTCSLLVGLLVDFGVFGLMLALCGYFARTRPKEPITYGFFMFAYISYCAIEINGFNFTLMYSLIFMAALAGLFVFLYHYRIQTYEAYTDANGSVHLVMLLSRYSAYVYVIHLMLFKLLKVAQHPELYIGFRWV